VSGKKTQTRRLIKEGELGIARMGNGIIATEYKAKPKWQVGKDYSVQVKEKELQKKFEVDKNTAVQEVQTKLDTTDKDFQVVKDENAILSEFKSNIEKKKREILENEVYVKFEKLNGVESYENLKKESIKYSIEELEEELKRGMKIQKLILDLDLMQHILKLKLI